MYSIGIDLGGTNICVGLVDEKGNILTKLTTPTINERSSDLIIGDMASMCNKIIEENGLLKKDVKCIGIGCPGLIDTKNGIVVYSCNLNFDNVRLSEEMEKLTGLPIFIENDANCAALGESLWGGAMGFFNSITITLGTGVGAGIVIDKKVYHGAFNGGTEIGHMVIKVDGEECGCGHKGCWEAYASASALIRDARITAAKYPHSKLFQLSNGDIRTIDAKMVFDAADEGDSHSEKLLENYYKYIAVGISNLINIFEPQIIIMGGGVCAQGERLINAVKANVKKLVYGGDLKTEIAAAKLGNAAGIVGAAMLCEGHTD